MAEQSKVFPKAMGWVSGLLILASASAANAAAPKIISASALPDEGGLEFTSAVAMDAAGNTYLARTGGDYGEVVLVEKRNARDKRVFLASTGVTTYTGFGAPNWVSIAVDSKENVFVVASAYTAGKDFDAYPPGSPLYQTCPRKLASIDSDEVLDVVIMKLDKTGAYSASTCIGGIGFESVQAVQVDSAGNLYVLGTPPRSGFPNFNAVQKTWGAGYLFKMDNSLSKLIYSTYIGGTKLANGSSTSASMDTPTDLAVDAAGNAYIVGSALSDNFKTVRPIKAKRSKDDIFLEVIDPAGSAITFSSYYGGSGMDGPLGVAVDKDANMVITGYTTSKDFPMVAPLKSSFSSSGVDGFVVKINTKSASVSASSFFSGYMYGGVVTDAQGYIYMAGNAPVGNVDRVTPVAAPAGTKACTSGADGDETDLYVVKLDPAITKPSYSFCMGGTSLEEIGQGFAGVSRKKLAIGPANTFAVIGESFGVGFPWTEGPSQENWHHNFLVKISDSSLGGLISVVPAPLRPILDPILGAK